jgi:hypothetical protein
MNEVNGTIVLSTQSTVDLNFPKGQVWQVTDVYARVLEESPDLHLPANVSSKFLREYIQVRSYLSVCRMVSVWRGLGHRDQGHFKGNVSTFILH